jgi:hypothetical protein
MKIVHKSDRADAVWEQPGVMVKCCLFISANRKHPELKRLLFSVYLVTDVTVVYAGVISP